MLRFWNRVLKMDDNRITCRIFDYDCKLCKGNWRYDIKQLFSNVNNNTIYDEKMICNIYELQQYIDDKWKEKWKSNLPIKPKLRTYITFKDNYCTDRYFKECLPRKERSLLAQIRFSILPLHIETGRFRSLNLEERTCKICTSQDIEDEFHIIISCNPYIEIQQAVYNCITSQIEEFIHFNHREKVIHITKYEWKSLGKYLISAWDKRNNKLNVIISNN